MSDKKPFKKVGTHDGRFHADEVVATAILKEIFEVEITRTRDSNILNQLDIIYDVGGGEFDHHGIEKEYREDGVPYAACGLIWRRFGKDVISFVEPSLSDEEIDTAFNHVDQVLIKGIDAQDNGIRTGEETIPHMTISSIIGGFNPPWDSERPEDVAFNEAVDIASSVLKNTMNRIFSIFKSRDIIVKAYENREKPEVLVLDTSCPWEDNLLDIDEKKEVLFVVYPNKDRYSMQTVRGDDGKDKRYLPESWAGKENEELAEVTGVEDAIFCHTGRFIAVAKSFEGIMKMAELALK